MKVEAERANKTHHQEGARDPKLVLPTEAK